MVRVYGPSTQELGQEDQELKARGQPGLHETLLILTIVPENTGHLTEQNPTLTITGSQQHRDHPSSFLDTDFKGAK